MNILVYHVKLYGKNPRTDSCRIPLGESEWILALGCEFLTLPGLVVCIFPGEGGAVRS